MHATEFNVFLSQGESLYEIWIPVESFQMRAAPMISAAAAGVVPKIDLKGLFSKDTSDE